MNKEIKKLVTVKKLEQPILIEIAEELFRRQRGYVFRLPPKNSPVVVAFSGGADSICSTLILLEDYGLQIYPYFIKRGARAEQYEEESVDYFAKYFCKKYPKLFHQPTKLVVPVPASEIKKDLPLKLRKGFGYPLRNTIIMSYGIQYAASLLTSRGIKARTVFESIVSSDADQTMHSTLTTLRFFNLHVCIDMGDWEWQTSSIAMETELGNYYDKDFLVKRASEFNLPVHKTRSCIEASATHCGICPSCIDRIRIFKELGINDQTIYNSNK